MDLSIPGLLGLIARVTLAKAKNRGVSKNEQHVYTVYWYQEQVMNRNALYRLFARTFFFIAIVTLCIAFLEQFANLFGVSIFREAYTPGRLVELSAALLLFVITILLRQIRNALRKSNGGF
jgi:hypothetical protein